MDVYADIVATAGVVIAGVALFIGWRESRQRGVWERQQERHQVAFNRPDLVPTGATFPGLRGKPYQLATEGEHRVEFHNEGNSTPSDVRTVLFPSASYIVPSSLPPMRAYGLGGLYWEGGVDVSPAADGRCSATLQSKRSPLRGDMHVIDGHSLFAPPQPDAGEVAMHIPFAFARLTLTYRDRTGRLLATAFDIDAETMQWRRVAGPIEVEHDLHGLADEASRQYLHPSSQPQ